MRGAAELLSLVRRAAIAAALAITASGCDNENLTACVEYRDYFESLPCTAGVDPGVDCNAFADYPCPIPGYFDCLRATQRCTVDEGGNPEHFVCQEPDDEGCAGLTLSSCADLLECSG